MATPLHLRATARGPQAGSHDAWVDMPVLRLSAGLGARVVMMAGAAQRHVMQEIEETRRIAQREMTGSSSPQSKR